MPGVSMLECGSSKEAVVAGEEALEAEVEVLLR